MEIKRTIEISVEKTRRLVIRQPETDRMISCPVCGEPMLTAEAAAVLFQINCRRVYQIVEAGAAHFRRNRRRFFSRLPRNLSKQP